MPETRSTRGRRTIAATRRRELGSASARALLLTILGEFVHPRRESVWTSSLIQALGAVGVEEKAARQAMARTAAEGLLTSERHGRQVLWSLSEAGSTVLQEGTERIYGFMRHPPAWDGSWLVLTVAVPESQRTLRHRLRTQLNWLGLGSPASGLWVTPDTGKTDAVHHVLCELGLDKRAFAWSGPASGIGEESKLLADTWDLDEVEDRYLGFIAEYENRVAESPGDAFALQVQLVQDWRRFPFLDPNLPRELLNQDWPGPLAATLFHDRHARWHRQAQREWDRMDQAGGAKPD